MVARRACVPVVAGQRVIGVYAARRGVARIRRAGVAAVAVERRSGPASSVSARLRSVAQVAVITIHRRPDTRPVRAMVARRACIAVVARVRVVDVLATSIDARISGTWIAVVAIAVRRALLQAAWNGNMSANAILTGICCTRIAVITIGIVAAFPALAVAAFACRDGHYANGVGVRAAAAICHRYRELVYSARGWHETWLRDEAAGEVVGGRCQRVGPKVRQCVAIRVSASERA